MPYKSHYAKNEYQREWVRKNWLAAIELLGGKCVQCGTTESLEIDHIDPATKVSHRIWSWSKERRLAELKKCQILCSGCHKRKTLEYAGIAPSKILAVHKAGCGCGGCQNARYLEVAMMMEKRTRSQYRTIRRARERERAVGKYEVFA